MSDPSANLLPAIVAALIGDAVFGAAMGGNAKVYGIAPTNAAKPYTILAGSTVTPVFADCFDLSEADVSLDIWSLTDPPGQAQAMAIAAAGEAVMLGALAIDGFVISAQRVRIQHLTDPRDGKTAHSIVVVRYSADPV